MACSAGIIFNFIYLNWVLISFLLQFGKVDSVEKLAELKGDVNQVDSIENNHYYIAHVQSRLMLLCSPSQAAANGATPVHMAAQSGFDSCIKKLAELRAHLSNADKDGITPLHQVTRLATVLSIDMSFDHIS